MNLSCFCIANWEEHALYQLTSTLYTFKKKMNQIIKSWFLYHKHAVCISVLKNYIVFIYYILYSSLTKLKHFFRVRRLWGELNIATHIIHPPRPVILLEVSYYIDFHPLHPCLSISVLLWGRTSTELGLITSQISHFQVFSVQAREYQHTLFVHLLNGVHWNRAMNPKQLAPRHMSIHPSISHDPHISSSSDDHASCCWFTGIPKFTSAFSLTNTSAPNYRSVHERVVDWIL